MGNNPVTPILLGAAVIFVALTVRDGLATTQSLSPRQRTWLRLAVAFSGVAIALHIAGLFVG